MKFKISIILLIFALMAVIPIIAVKTNTLENKNNSSADTGESASSFSVEEENSSAENTEANTEATTLKDAEDNTDKDNEVSTDTEIETSAVNNGASISDNELLKGMIWAKSNAFNREGLKALAVVFNTNIKADKEKIDISNPSEYISESEIKSAHPDDFEKITETAESIIKETENMYLSTDDGNLYFIPVSQCSNGSTLRNDDINMASVASPWDCFSENYSINNECTGISLDGVDYLSENNDYSYILSYYLPNFKINR